MILIPTSGSKEAGFVLYTEKFFKKEIAINLVLSTMTHKTIPYPILGTDEDEIYL